MMISILKALSLCCLLGIIYQDFNERKVYLWLLISAGIALSMLFFQYTNATIYALNIGVNILIISMIIFILFVYTKYRLKIAFSSSIGLGDLLFFICIAIGFPIATFIVLFTCSLFFAVLLFWLLKSFFDKKTIPLAGLQALFMFLIIGINWSFHLVNLYLL